MNVIILYYFQVLVVDKPSPPIGPLDVSDITPDTCTLAWKPPLDDGGSPITNYVVEKMDNNGVRLLIHFIINIFQNLQIFTIFFLLDLDSYFIICT